MDEGGFVGERGLEEVGVFFRGREGFRGGEGFGGGGGFREGGSFGRRGRGDTLNLKNTKGVL